MAEDKYVNQAFIRVNESGANTLTFQKLETGIPIYEKIGWVVHRLDYFYVTTVVQFPADGASLSYGISAMDSLATVDLQLAAVIDMNMITRRDWGVAASGALRLIPIVKNFTELPGGGLLIPPNPLYLFAKGTNLAAAQGVDVRMFYTVIKLKPEDFWELVEQRRMIGA